MFEIWFPKEKQYQACKMTKVLLNIRCTQKEEKTNNKLKKPISKLNLEIGFPFTLYYFLTFAV